MIECPNCGNKLEDNEVDICPHCDFSMIDDDSENHLRRNRYILMCLVIMLIIATPTITIMTFFPLHPP